MTLRIGGKLYRQIYLGFLGIALFCLLTAFFLVQVFGDRPMRPPPPLGAGLSLLVEPILALPDAELSVALADLSRKLRSDLTIYGSNGHKKAWSDQNRGPESIVAKEFGWVRVNGDMGVASPLPNGNTVVAWRRERPEPPWLGRLGAWMALFLILVAIGCFPLARWLTRRLERLKQAVDRWGEGDLSVRAMPSGHDEVAQLSVSFNRAADRIEQLIGAQRLFLAKTSHEFRTPLSRIRMALQLLEDNAHNPALERHFTSISQDTEELDKLVGDILLISRLESRVDELPNEIVDLFSIAQEEGTHFGVVTTGTTGKIRGQARLLRRLVRNLIDNAMNYGEGNAVELGVEQDGTEVRLKVRDRGPGVLVEEREMIFEPFFRGKQHSGQTRGTGLGLTIVRDIARFHHGRVEVQPHDGGGSVFVVTFPAIAC